MPKEIFIEHFEGRGFVVSGAGPVWGKRTFKTVAALAAFLDKHDYRYRWGTFGEHYLP